MLINPDAVAPEELKKIKLNAFERFGLDPDEYMIPVSVEDARRLATNVRCIGNHVFIPDCSTELQNAIRAKGYKVTAVNLREYLYAGGSGHCLSNNIDEERIIGGIARSLGLVDQLPWKGSSYVPPEEILVESKPAGGDLTLD
mgnify:FL=1